MNAADGPSRADKSTKMPRRVRIIFVVIVVVVAGALIVYGTFVKRTADSLTTPQTNPAQYSALLASWKSTGLVNLFPLTIPVVATNIHFSEFPGLGQGGPWIQLQMQLPANEVAAIEADARSRTSHVYTPDHQFYLPATNGDWPIPNYYVTKSSNPRFPSTFTLYVVSAVDRGLGSWDPYDSYGVAISKETNEVVYWADQ